MEIKSPNIVELVKPSVFLAGGITNCPDWQKQFIDHITINNIDIINPRREIWDDTRNNDDVSKEQIEWEYNYLNKTTGVIFWFPKETLCPITLFELGSALQSKNVIAIGIDPEYQRKLDVEIQIKLVNSNIPIVYSIVDLVNETTKYFENYKSFEDYNAEINLKYTNYRKNIYTRSEVEDIVTVLQMEQYSKLTKEEIIREAKKLIIQYGGIDGSHHKDWCLDQVFRILTGDNYYKEVESACTNEETGEIEYDWDIGVAP